MQNISNSPTSCKPDVTVVSTGTCPADRRAYWQAEAHHQGSDWPGIINLHFAVVDQLRSADDADARGSSS